MKKRSCGRWTDGWMVWRFFSKSMKQVGNSYRRTYSAFAAVAAAAAGSQSHRGSACSPSSSSLAFVLKAGERENYQLKLIPQH